MSKPGLNGAGNFKQGIYIPKFPEKYRGNPSDIKYRSSWEYKMMKYLDYSGIVKRWNSEPFSIPYISPLDNKQHQYWIDFWFERNDGKQYLIELKPYTQTLPPPPLSESVRSLKKKLQYNYAAKNYLVNRAKWEAAKKVAESNGATFMIITEKDIKL